MSAPTPKTSSSSCLSGCSAQAPAPPLEVRRERERQLEEELRRAWRRPVATTATAKDVPRLATRIEVQAWDGGASPGKKMKKKKKPHPSAKRARERRRMSEQAESMTLSVDASKNSIVQTVRALAEYFGEDEAARADIAIGEASDASAADGSSGGPDLRLFCERLLDALGGDDSRIVRVLKCCHQNILFIAIMELKKDVLKDILTKDNRDADGWRIQLKCEEKRVQVTHLRRDRIISATPGAASLGVLSWEVSLTFDREMVRLDSTGLRLTGLTLSRSAEATDRQRLTRALSSGSLILR